METRSRHENFRSRQNLVQVRKSHVAMEFIGIEIGNGYRASGKLVTIRHSACDRVLGVQRHALGMRTTKHSVHDRVVLS